jgi:porin
MMRKFLALVIGFGFILGVLLMAGSVLGYDINDKFSIGGIIAGAYQHQWLDDDASGQADDNIGRGAVNFEPEFSFRPNENNELFAKFGFGAGNGLNGVTDFNLAPWAANLEDDYKDINGRNRDYLLTAWYKYTFNFSESNALGLTGGIIDSTDYIDENAYANDEFTQFMNEALVNGPNGFFPSFDIGGAAQWEVGNFDITALGMNIGENDDGNDYHFFAGQLAYKLETTLGEGNYRVIVDGTSEQFLDEDGDKERRTAVTLSFDQALGDIFGAWIRFGWQDDAALINYDALYSGGLNITGKWYGREEDNVGIGYAYINGDNDSDIDRTQVLEVYWRVAFNDYFCATADFQYVQDKYDNSDDDIDGIIGGIRMTAEF